MLFQITDKEIEIPKLRASLLREDSGGYVSFEGWVRNHHNNLGVTKLVYTSYRPMAEKLGSRIVEAALETFDINAAKCVHRIGDLAIGEVAVWVGVSAGHRGEAFAACKYIIDMIKQDVPIWKHEYYVDGTDEWTLNHMCG